MWITVLSMMALSFTSDAGLWIPAWEAQEGPVQMEAAGEYVVWVWVQGNTPTTLSLNEKHFSVEKKRREKDPAYLWDRAGTVTLEAGELRLEAGPGIVLIALGAGEGYDPRKALTAMRVLDAPEAVQDQRAHWVRHTNTVFTMPPYASKAEWEAAAAVLRRRLLIAAGLYPLPDRTPLNPLRSGRIEEEGYAVERLAIEARPGFYVTGNLYQPLGKSGPFPGVVCPHGHWEHGRLEHGERGSVPARCATLARMGMVVFSYDMIGYNDSLQFPHGWGGNREKLWGLHPFAMQLWSSIRAVDYLQSLDMVDPDRIGCTGASGGGTQTFALMAVDPRIKIAAPVNMISSTMQGGCGCENAPIIRLENANMEIGALMAPRPLLMISATGDWTRETPHVEYPAIRSIYALYGAEHQVRNVHIDAPHNYNLASREAMYPFFGKHLLGGDWEGYKEPAFTPLDTEALRVFPDKKLPQTARPKEQLIEEIIEATRAKWAALLPRQPEALPAFQEEYGAIFSDIMNARPPALNTLRCERTGMEEHGDWVLERWILGRKGEGDAIPAIYYRAADPAPQDAVLISHGAGKAALADMHAGGPGPLVKGLMDAGKAVLCVDVFLQGEQHAPAKKTLRQRVGNYMDTFQPTTTGYRVQDVLTAAAFLHARRDLSGRIALIGLTQAGLWTMLAAAIDSGITDTIVDLNEFNPEDDEAWVADYYIPCIRAAGDLQTAAALIAPRKLTLFNTGQAAMTTPGVKLVTGDLTAETLIEAVR